MSDEKPKTLADMGIAIAVLKSEFNGIKEDIEKLVTRVEFAPIKIIVYSLCGCILSSVLAAILAKIIIK